MIRGEKDAVARWGCQSQGTSTLLSKPGPVSVRVSLTGGAEAPIVSKRDIEIANTHCSSSIIEHRYVMTLLLVRNPSVDEIPSTSGRTLEIRAFFGVRDRHTGRISSANHYLPSPLSE
jgi:hypothetical protein